MDTSQSLGIGDVAFSDQSIAVFLRRRSLSLMTPLGAPNEDERRHAEGGRLQRAAEPVDKQILEGCARPRGAESAFAGGRGVGAGLPLARAEHTVDGAVVGAAGDAVAVAGPRYADGCDLRRRGLARTGG